METRKALAHLASKLILIVLDGKHDLVFQKFILGKKNIANKLKQCFHKIKLIIITKNVFSLC